MEFSHSQVAVVRDRIENPPEKKQFEKLCEVMTKNLDLLYEHSVFRTEFKNKFGRDLRDLLAPGSRGGKSVRDKRQINTLA